MHELPIMSSIFKVVLKHAHTNQVTKVISIHLEIDGCSDLEDKWMQQYFDYLSKGGVADGAKLVVERVPVVFSCATCEFSFELDLKGDGGDKFTCPQCGGDQLTLKSKREYLIRDMEVL